MDPVRVTIPAGIWTALRLPEKSLCALSAQCASGRHRLQLLKLIFQIHEMLYIAFMNELKVVRARLKSVDYPPVVKAGARYREGIGS